MSAVTTAELEADYLVSTRYGILTVACKYRNDIGLEVVNLQNGNGRVRFIGISDYGLRQIEAHPYYTEEQDRVEHD